MAGKFISLKGMAEAKNDEACLNGKIKRGELKGYVTFRPCGCGADHVLPVVMRYRDKETGLLID